jgi:hypothetical protein
MIDKSVAGLQEELRYSKARYDPLLEGWEDDIAAFVGPAFRRAGSKNKKNMPENHAFEWFSLMLADLALGDPRVRITTDRPGEAQMRASALSYGCNAWSRQVQSRHAFEKFVMDFGLRYAIALVTSEPKPGYQDAANPPYWPAIHRVSPKRFLSDHSATGPETWQWAAHLVIESVDTLLERAKDPDSGWNEEVLNKLETDQTSANKFRGMGVKTPDRKEIAYWEFWVPGETLDESPGVKKGYHGSLFTVVDGQNSKLGWARDPQPYFGPRTGPYTIGGCYVVPDESAPLASILATKSQEVYLNRISNAIRKNVEEYKRIILITSGDPNLPGIITNGKDQYVFNINDPNVRAAVNSMEMAGITQNHLEAKMDARNTLDRISGITDAMRGNVTGDATATENAMAGQAASKRVLHITSKFKSFTSECFKNVAYFIDRDEDVVLDLGPEADGKIQDPQTGQPMQGPIKVKGGLRKGQSPDEFELLNCRVEIGSMERNLEMDVDRKQNIIEQTIQFLAMSAAQAPFVDWQKYLDVKAELTGIEELRYILDTKVLAMQAAALMGQGGQPPSPTPNPKPAPKSIFYSTPGSTGQSGKQVQQRNGATAAAAQSKPAQKAKSAIGGGPQS